MSGQSWHYRTLIGMTGRPVGDDRQACLEERTRMAKLVFGMNQSLDGYVDHTAFVPSRTLFRHFIDEAQSQAGCIYGRQMYEVMRYWDDENLEWGDEEVDFAAARRRSRRGGLRP